MDLVTVDTEALYRRLLDTPDPTARDALYRGELLAPFGGMFRIFGGGDPVALAKGWTLYTPEDFGGEARPAITALVDRLAAADAWGRTAAALARAAAAFAPHADHIRLDTVTAALVLGRGAPADPLDRGYTGFGGIPGYVLVVCSDANDYVLPRLDGAAAHELHHNVRFSLFPFIPHLVTVGEYIVAEGLAEAFAAELFGEGVVGYYVTEFPEAELAAATRAVGAALDATGFDTVRAYIFGDTITARAGRPAAGVPDFAGYALGYRAVRAYLRRTGTSVVEATFVPAAEIIAGSGLFV